MRRQRQHDKISIKTVDNMATGEQKETGSECGASERANLSIFATVRKEKKKSVCGVRERVNLSIVTTVRKQKKIRVRLK